MKQLLLSLYFFVFIALIGLGWGIDAMYQHYSSQKIPTFPQSEHMITTLQKQLDQTVQPVSSIYLSNLWQLEATDQFILPEPLKTQLNKGEVVTLNSAEGITLHKKLNTKPYILSLGPLPISTEENLEWVQYLLTALFYSALALILLLWFRPLVLAVLHLSKALKNIASGKLDTRLKKKSLYLGELYQEFNQMAQQLEILSEDNQLLSQAVSHDIRTPLSRILFAIEKLKRNESSELRSVAQSIEKGVEQIELLSKELLEYARIGKTRQIKKENIDLIVLTEQVIAGFEHSGKSIILDHQLKGSEFVLDPELIQKVLNNLVSNAVRYSQRQIKINISEQHNILEMIIEDDGQGFDLSNKTFAEYCQPFIQHQKSEKHFGLGLAIVDRLINQMNGAFSLNEQKSLSGASFKVQIPVES
ncbi:MAG: GHKL domain-containing protein [Gammaproteobacteria bacterium]|nr:GHKL domain-containing protein [Gammaproteobacteria bacterium]